MKGSAVVSCFVCCFALFGAVAAAAAETGAVSGRISPKGASVRIIAKTAGTEHRIKANVKGEVTLEKGGDFTIKGLPPGKYDLLFFLQGESKKKYTAARWSEVVVKAGETTSGIHCRLTPQGSPHLIDEVIVAFKPTVSDAAARKIIRQAGCTVKDAPLRFGGTAAYTVDIPDDKSVAEMIKLFKQKKGVKYVEPNGIVTIGF